MINEQNIPFRWMNLTSHEAQKVRQILEGANGWVARNLNKRCSIPISIYLARWGVSPNQITFVNLIFGILSGILAAFGGYWHLLAGGLLFQWVSIMDGCDGEVAKLNGQATRFGAWFDTVGDNLSFVVFVVGVTFGFYHHTHAHWVMVLAEVALVSFAILLCIMVSYLLRNQDGKASLTTYEKEVLNTTFAEKTGWFAIFVRRGKFLIKKDFFALLFSFLAVVNLPQGIVFFAALGSGAVALILSIMTLKQWRFRKADLPEQATELSQ